MGLIFYGSTGLLSAQNTSRFIGPLLRWACPGISDQAVEAVQVIVRKGGHLTEYAVLALLLWRARRQPVQQEPRPWRWSDARWAMGTATLYAVTDEIHQALVVSRQGSAWDVLLDAVGAAAGLLAVWGIRRWRGNG